MARHMTLRDLIGQRSEANALRQIYLWKPRQQTKLHLFDTMHVSEVIQLLMMKPLTHVNDLSTTTYLRIVETECLSLTLSAWNSGKATDVGESERKLGFFLRGSTGSLLSFFGGEMLDMIESANFMM